MRVGHPNPNTGGKTRGEEMFQARIDAMCSFNLLGTRHEVVKEKPKTAVAWGGLCNRKYHRVHFSMSPRETSFSWDPIWKLFYPLESQEL